MKKTKKELLEIARKRGKKYYHKHKAEINRKRKKDRNNKTKKRSIIRRRKRSTTPIRTHSNSLEKIVSLGIPTGGRLRIHCPVHKNQILIRLVYNTAKTKKPTRQNKRGVVGTRGQTDLFYCPNCDIARKVNFTIEQ